jgi:hypothetical protein
MQLSPQALPFEQILQQAADPDPAHAGEAQLTPAGPIASSAATTKEVLNFMAIFPLI